MRSENSENLTPAAWKASPGWGLRFWGLAAVWLWCAIPLSPSTVDSDFWGHVQYGQDTLQYGVAESSTYAFTAENHRWINHENLCEITFAWLTQRFGAESILVLKCLMGLGVIGLMMRSAISAAVPSWMMTVVAPVVAINLSFYWGMRPQVFSFTLFAITIAISDRFLSKHRIAQISKAGFLGLIVGLAVLFAAWANSHGGFVAGICVFNLLLAGRAVEAFVTEKQLDVRNRIVRRCIVLALSSSAATLLNPYGIDLHLWLMESLRIPRPEVTEWHAPNLFGAGAFKIWLMLVMSAVGILFSFRSTTGDRDWPQLTVFAVVLIQAFMHQRHLPFVAILFGFWVPARLYEALKVLKVLPDDVGSTALFAKKSKMTTPWFAIGPIAALCLVLAFQAGSRLLSVMVPYERYPVAAVQFMADHDIEDKIVVTGEWAQYVLAVSGARTPGDDGCRVAFDGRFRTCYPQTVVDMHFDFFRGDALPRMRYRSPDSPPADPNRVLEFGSPNLVLLKNSEVYATAVVSAASDWSLLYRDRTAQLWGRSSIYDQPDSKNYLAATERFDATDLDSTSQSMASKDPRIAAWPAAPRTRDTETAFVSQTRGDNGND